MIISAYKENSWQVESDSGSTYYIVRHTCPSCHEGILVCSCPDFQLGRPSRGIDPFHDPCKHIIELYKETHHLHTDAHLFKHYDRSVSGAFDAAIKILEQEVDLIADRIVPEDHTEHLISTSNLVDVIIERRLARRALERAIEEIKSLGAKKESQ